MLRQVALGAVFFAAALAAEAQRTTVCTITVNSADERDAFREHLSADRYEFIELVERGRPDWLASACRRKVRCDVLLVSGHFAGTEFYSSKPHIDETLPVDEIERAICSESCPGLFSRLKEVYLFGCDTLKPEPVGSATPEIIRGLVKAGLPRAEAEQAARMLSERNTESSRGLMRRLFAGVPVIYGFSSLAPYGRTAGPMLHGYFRSSPDEPIGSGRVSAKLLSLFGPASMVATLGRRDSEPNADYRAEVCRYFDDRLTSGQKLAFMHAALGGGMPAMRMAFVRIEKFFAMLSDADRRDASFIEALAALRADAATRSRYLEVTRETDDPALRARMISLARAIGWLSAEGRRAELGRMIREMLAGDAMGYGDVDLICGLNRERDLDGELHEARAPAAKRAVQAAAMACLGSAEGHARTLRALASADDGDVQVAQAYLRHRAIGEGAQLRKVVLDVARMKGSVAQVRALETLARQHVSDRDVLDELARLYARTASLPVQRAIAEIFIRSGTRATPEAAALLRERRIKAPGGGADLIDTLLGRL